MKTQSWKMYLFNIALASALYLVSSVRTEAINIEDAVKTIIAAPDWTTMNGDNLSIEGQKLVKILRSFMELKPEEAKSLVSALNLLQIKRLDTGIAGKILIYNRLYCNVPSKPDRNGRRNFGGWNGSSGMGFTVDALYPLTQTDEGWLGLNQAFGGYTGPLYRGLEEFDYFYAKFGKRIIKRIQWKQSI